MNEVIAYQGGVVGGTPTCEYIVRIAACFRNVHEEDPVQETNGCVPKCRQATEESDEDKQAKRENRYSNIAQDAHGFDQL